MKARYLGLFGVGMCFVAAWGCASQEAGGDAPDTLSDNRGGDLRVDPSSKEGSDKSGSGAAGPALTATESGKSDGGASSVGSLWPAKPPDCKYNPIGDIHLSQPSVRPLASPVLARGFLTAGRAPSASSVHPKEFLNYYPVTYPETSTDVTVAANVARGALPTELMVQIAVQAPSAARHRKLALVVVVDTSLSMAGESMARARSAVASMARALTPGDSFTLVTSGAKPSPSIPIVAAGDVSRAIEASKALEADGGEHLGAALADAYLVAADKPGGAELARVVLITDGAARADEIDLGIVAGNHQLADIPLIGVGVGDAISYENDLIETATRVGGGASIYLDSVDEAPRMLEKRFDQIMDVWVEEVQVTLSLPDYLRVQGVQTSDLTDSPSGLARSDLPLGRTMIFRQMLESCADVGTLPITTFIGVSVRWRQRGKTQFIPEMAVGGTMNDLGLNAQPATPQITKASLVLAYADALATVRPAQLEAVHTAITKLQSDPAAPPELATDADLDEIAGLAKDFLDAAAAAAAPP